MLYSALAAGLLVSSLNALPVAALDPMTESTLSAVRANAISGSTKSWENGTLARALTELDVLPASPYTDGSIPPPSDASSSELAKLAQAVVSDKIKSFGANVLSDTWPSRVRGMNLSLLDDGAAGDPASLGEVVIWANATGLDGYDWVAAVRQEVLYLTTVVPRTSDGAISHRYNQVQLWSDSAYMVPPFLAYYAALTNNQTLMTDALAQPRLYRQYLGTSSGLWKHIQLGDGSQDPGTWCTGNGWAAAGMMRVHTIVSNSPFAGSFQNELNNIKDWINEILTGAFNHQMSSGLIRDYPENSTSFADASCTALLSATAYRMSSLKLSSQWIPDAERAYKNITTQLAASSDGWLAPVVNPYAWGQPGSKSPEGQSFVLLMEAARRAWVEAGSDNAKGKVTQGDDGKSAGARTTAIGGCWLATALVLFSVGVQLS